MRKHSFLFTEDLEQLSVFERNRETIAKTQLLQIRNMSLPDCSDNLYHVREMEVQWYRKSVIGNKLVD